METKQKLIILVDGCVNKAEFISYCYKNAMAVTEWKPAGKYSKVTLLAGDPLDWYFLGLWMGQKLSVIEYGP